MGEGELALLLTLILSTTLRPPAFASAILRALSLSAVLATVPASSILSLVSFTMTFESSGCFWRAD